MQSPIACCRYAQSTLELIDNQGRAVIVDLGPFVLINLYAPAVTNIENERFPYKMALYEVGAADVHAEMLVPWRCTLNTLVYVHILLRCSNEARTSSSCPSMDLDGSSVCSSLLPCVQAWNKAALSCDGV